MNIAENLAQGEAKAKRDRIIFTRWENKEIKDAEATFEFNRNNEIQLSADELKSYVRTLGYFID